MILQSIKLDLARRQDLLGWENNYLKIKRIILKKIEKEKDLKKKEKYEKDLKELENDFAVIQERIKKLYAEIAELEN